MLQITIPATEGWDEAKEEFVPILKEQTLVLEHSLVSISKWESKWLKPYFSKEAKSREETLDYVRCMTITQNVNPEVYERLTADNLAQINKYLDSPMTATWFNDSEHKSKGGKVQLTNELIYYNMIAYNIPVEFQKWHLNRLLTLIKVCEIKNRKPEKQNRRERLQHFAALNAKRRQQYKSKG